MTRAMLATVGAAEARDWPPIKTTGAISDVGNKITWHVGYLSP